MLALAGLGLVVVNALAESSWGTFTIASTIPIAFIMGVWMFKIRKGKTLEATIFGVIMLILVVILGRYVPDSQFAGWFSFNYKTLTILIAIYGFLAAVLPVWLLLVPRGYLSSIMKISFMMLLALGIIIVAPEIKMPAFTEFSKGGGDQSFREIIPLPFYYYCLRCNFRFSLTCKFRDNF